MSVLTATDRRPSRSTSWRDSRLAKRADDLYATLSRYVGDRTKIATIGGDQETQFEQAFASLAYTFIKDKAPRLLDFLVGFQLVDRNDDNTKAVGIFGFNVGKSWIYSPVFFLNGDLKGHELLYLKEQDMFVPMKENWVNYVISKKPHVLGNSVRGTSQGLNIQSPDIRSLSMPPHNSKYGSAADEPRLYPNLAVAEGWMPPADGFKHVYAAMTSGGLAGSFMRSLEKHAGFHAEDLLKQFVRESVAHCKYAMEVCEKYPGIADCMNKFYGADFFKEALLDIRGKIEKAAATQLPDELNRTVLEYHFGGGAKARRKKPTRRVLDKKADELPNIPGRTSVLGGKQLPAKWAAAETDVEIKTREDYLTTENGPQLSELNEEEAAAVARDGYLVKDHRTGEEVSTVYNTQIEMQLVNPDGSGLYEILQKPGEFVKCIVLANAHAPNGRQDFATVVRLEPRHWLNAHRTVLFGKPNTTSREDFEKWYNGLSDKQSLEEGGVYLIVSQNGEGSTPFQVVRKLGGEGRYEIMAFKYVDRHRPGYLPATARENGNDYDDSFRYGPELLYLDDRDGRSFRSSQNILQAPKEHKILELKKPEKPKDDSPCGCMPVSMQTQSEDSTFEPGNLADLQMELLQKTSALKVYVDGNEASINNGQMQSKTAALFDLIRVHGLRARDAKGILKLADQTLPGNRKTNFRIQYGPNYPRTKAAFGAEMLMGGPSAPAIPEASFGYDQSYGGVPLQYMEQYNQPVPELDSAYTDPMTYSPMPDALPDPMLMQQAQQAGQMGQKEVFDTAMITGLLKSVRQDSLVGRYMGDLLKALDRLGRVLFMFYWHNDEFIDRYGKSDAPELEDTLRNSFETLGDLVLFLKEKDVEPLTRGDQGDPDVEEASLN